MGKDFGVFGKIYPKGEIICRQGDPGDEMFIIQSGAVEISSRREGRKVVLTILEKGDFFGEMALFDGKPRSATVTTIARSRLLPLSRRVFLEKVEYQPDIVFYVLKALARRIDRMTGQIRDMIDDDAELRSLLIAGDPAGVHPDNACSHQPAIKSRPADRRMEDSSGGSRYLRPVRFGPGFLQFGSKPAKKVDTGQVVFEHGDKGDRMYFIEEGTVEIYQATADGDLCLALLGAGDFFGEMALIADAPRSASARALEPARLRAIGREDMRAGILTDPDMGQFFLRMLIDRLRIITRALEEPERSLKTLRQAVLPKFKKTEKISIGFCSLSSCGGCTVMLVRTPEQLGRITDKARVRYCPMLMDQEQILETDIAVVDGAVRTREDEQKLFAVRRNSRVLVAWGTCAAFGGLPALANAFELEELVEESYGRTIDPFAYYLKGRSFTSSYRAVDIEEHLLRKVRKLSDVVKVDYYLPGCPPIMPLLENLLREMKAEQLFDGNRQIVCGECPRKFNKPSAIRFDVFPGQSRAVSACLLSQGTLCLGLVTRGGCQAACSGGGLPCWGCRGPADHIIKKINDGELVEEIVLQALARRLKQPASKIKPSFRVLRFRTGSALGFGEHFIRDVSKIR